MINDTSTITAVIKYIQRTNIILSKYKIENEYIVIHKMLIYFKYVPTIIVKCIR